jgi:hypothetical protein
MSIKLRIQHQALFIVLGLLVILSLSAGLFVNPVQAGSLTDPGSLADVQPSGNQAALPSLRAFASTLVNGNARAITGVYAPNLFALLVLQQPKGQPGFVSQQPDSVTLFGMARNYGTIALLAHNDLSGSLFFNLNRSQDVYLIYGDGTQQRYLITQVDAFQALQPDSPYSSFLDLSQPGHTLSVEDLFYRIYAAGDRLVFQTCIEKDGKLSWGRLFVTAVPAPAPAVTQFYPSVRDLFPL